MGGKACIRGLRVTVSTVLGLLAAGRIHEEILQAYPYLEREDIEEALAYAAWTSATDSARFATSGSSIGTNMDAE